MAHSETLKRYHLIISYLRNAAKSFEDIKMYIENEFDIAGLNLHFSKRTFQRDIQGISRLYDKEIKYSRSTNTYKLLYDENDTRTERLIEAYDIANTLSLGNEFSKYISFENRITLGTNFMLDCLTAIKNKRILEIKYRRYGEIEIIDIEILPFALKEYKQRWYLVGKDLGDEIDKVYGLDRIISLNITNKKRESSNNFNIEDFFKYKYGIMFSDKKPENIVLSFSTFQGKYIKSLPLHHSQKILIDNNEELKISLHLIPTLDFKKDLLRFADNVKIIKPKKLAKEIKELHYKSIK